MEMLTVSLDRFGAFYAYIERNDLGNVMSIIPFRYQGNVHPSMDINGNVYYTYVTTTVSPVTRIALKTYLLLSRSHSTATPLSAHLACNARLLGIAAAQEETTFESNVDGITARMYASTDQIFKDDNAIARIKEQFKEMRGPSGAKAIPVLEQGLTLHSMKLTPAETELLKSREMTINRICRIMRVPVHRVGVANSNTGTGDVFDL